MFKLAVALLAGLSISSAAYAKPKAAPPAVGKVACDQRYQHTCWGEWKYETGGREKARKSRQSFQPRHSGRRVHSRAAHVHRHARTPRHATERATKRLERREPSQASRSLHGVVGPLAEKAEQIVRECGSWIMSAVRHTQVAGSGRLSCHANGHAVDISGNPACIYNHLKGWRGGYSTDYSQVRCRGVACPHVHVSLGCSEDGKRFVHYGTKVRHARRHRMARS